MPLKNREPDAIDLWFAMQGKAWWKKWRWFVVGLGIIAVWPTFSISIFPNFSWVLASPGMFSDGHLTGEAYLWYRYHLHDSLIIPAILVPLTFAGSLEFPIELVAAVGFNSLQQRKRQQLRIFLWVMFDIFYILPVGWVVILLFFPFILLTGVWVILVIPFILTLTCWLVIFLAIAEFVVFVSTRQLENWIVGISVTGVVAIFILFRLFLLDSVQNFWNSYYGLSDFAIFWFVLKPIAVATLVSLVALVFLVRANKAPAEYMADG